MTSCMGSRAAAHSYLLPHFMLSATLEGGDPYLQISKLRLKEGLVVLFILNLQDPAQCPAS